MPWWTKWIQDWTENYLRSNWKKSLDSIWFRMDRKCILAFSLETFIIFSTHSLKLLIWDSALIFASFSINFWDNEEIQKRVHLGQAIIFLKSHLKWWANLKAFCWCNRIHSRKANLIKWTYEQTWQLGSDVWSGGKWWSVHSYWPSKTAPSSLLLIKILLELDVSFNKVWKNLCWPKVTFY